jgi:hypothetical protein
MVREHVLKREREEKKQAEGVLSGETVQHIGDKEDGEREGEESESRCLGCYPTKRTPVFNLHFTHSNLLCAAGPFQKEKQ